MKFFGLGVCAFLFFGTAFPAVAQDEEGSSAFNLDWTPVPVLKTADGKISFKLRGRVFWDNAWIDDTDGTLNLNATEFRTARVGVDGKLGRSVSVRFEADFAHKMVSYKDIFISWKGPLEVKGGHFKLAPSLDEATSSRFIPVMERAGFTDAFGFSRQFGISVAKASEKGLVTGGVFQGGFAGSGDDTGFMFATRVTRAPKIGDTQIHLGTAFRYRELGDNQANYRYRQRPHQHLAPRFVNTGRIADSDVFFGAEAGVLRGPFVLTSEVGILKANLVAPMPGQTDPTFWGGYVNVSYFLTGEESPYDPKKGGLARPKVKNTLIDGGVGAFQAVFRYDHVDLTDNGIFGGVQKTAIVGLNWWLTNHLKIAVNYSHSKVSQAFLVAANGADGANKIDAIGVRTQFDW